MKTLKIGICGWGNVATGLFKAIEKNSNLIQLNGGVNLTIDVIGARRDNPCLLYTSPSPRDATLSRMPSSA